MNNETKEARTAGVFGGFFIVTFLSLSLFIYAPVSHYLGKWNRYWDDTVRCKFTYPISEFDKIPE